MTRMALAALAGLGAHGAVGGWAVVTVENPPEYLEAGSQYRLEYSVRPHGQRVDGGLQGALRIETGATGDKGLTLQAQSAPGGKYQVTFTVPDADRVNLTIVSHTRSPGYADLALLPVPVVRQGQPRPALAPADQGRRLFVAKGCGTCHVNGDVPEFARLNRVIKGAAPELTGRRLEAAYVRQRITDPASLPAIGEGDLRMPNLGLAPAEVSALVAMISGSSERAGL